MQIFKSCANLAIRGRWYFFLANRSCWHLFNYGIAQHMPVSYRFQPLGRFSKFCRSTACKRLFRNSGKRINVVQSVNIYSGWEIEIGDDSSLGIGCTVSFNLKVGRDVMMGHDVIIIGENHQFSCLDPPMLLQGY